MRLAASSSEFRTDSRVTSPFLIFSTKLGASVAGLGGLLKVLSALLVGKRRESHISSKCKYFSTQVPKGLQVPRKSAV